MQTATNKSETSPARSMPATAKTPEIASSSVPDTLTALHVDPEKGLTHGEVDTRRKEHGWRERTAGGQASGRLSPENPQNRLETLKIARRIWGSGRRKCRGGQPLEIDPPGGSTEWCSGASTDDGKPNRLGTKAPVKPCRSFGGSDLRAARRDRQRAEVRHADASCRLVGRGHAEGRDSCRKSSPRYRARIEDGASTCVPDGRYGCRVAVPHPSPDCTAVTLAP